MTITEVLEACEGPYTLWVNNELTSDFGDMWVPQFTSPSLHEALDQASLDRTDWYIRTVTGYRVIVGWKLPDPLREQRS